MITNKELSDNDYVSLDAGLALKRIGYDIPVHTHYHIRDNVSTISITSNAESWLEYESVIDRPILQKALEWLREKHKVNLRVSKSPTSEKWLFDFLDLKTGYYEDSNGIFEEEDYNAAINKGIIAICIYIYKKLKNMKNFNKQSFKGKAIYKPTGKAGEYSEWACNFFTGCSHNCSYCYCKRGVMSHVWTETPQLKRCFADYDHAISVFEKELMANLDDLRKVGIFFSFTTDPMIPGKTLELTLRAAEVALKNNVPVQILTKRADWWDTDVWEEKAKSVFINYINKMAIGFTLTGRDDLEPGANLNSDRIEVMRLCKTFGFRTFASIEPIVDISLSEKMMRAALFHCDLFKVGLMSGGTKPEKAELKRMVNYWNPRLDKMGKKIYWKKSVVDYLGDDFTFWADSCVSADFNIFEH